MILQVQENSREPLLTEGDIDNSWFSLSLGGGENFVEPTPTRSLRTSPVEPRSPIPQPRVAEIDTHSRGTSDYWRLIIIVRVLFILRHLGCPPASRSSLLIAFHVGIRFS